MNRVKYTAYLLLLFVAVGCNGGKQGISGAVNVSGYDDTCKEISTFVENVEVIPLDKDHPVAYISKVTAIDSSFVIMANNGLFIFDSNGKFVGDLTHSGRGPGEWIRADSFVVRDSVVSIFDGALSKAETYTIDGKYVGSTEVPDRLLGNLYDIEYISTSKLFASNCIYHEDNNVFCVYDEDSQSKIELLSSPVTCDKGSVPTGIHPFCISGDKVLMVMPRSNVIYQYADGEVAPAYEVRTKQRVLSDKKLANITDFMPHVTDGKTFPGFSSIFDTKNYLVLGFYGLSATFIDKSTNKAMTVANHSSDFPFFKLIAQSGNKIYAVLSDVNLQLFMMSYPPEQGNKYSQLYESINTYVNEGYDTFLVSYEVK